MLKLKDLELRSYVDKKCTSFSYTLKDDWFWIGDFIEEVMQNA